LLGSVVCSRIKTSFPRLSPIPPGTKCTNIPTSQQVKHDIHKRKRMVNHTNLEKINLHINNDNF
jgi:hypothetical protein